MGRGEVGVAFSLNSGKRLNREDRRPRNPSHDQPSQLNGPKSKGSSPDSAHSHTLILLDQADSRSPELSEPSRL
ncbi:hypothetical protein EVAR_89825_1 [Eumeta japonica]|uniref:Uncharacterized protein n=1 Tax=Eumeta variegata TaxID=151549 RepID=A0A4C1YIN0_EUMVA|nr:hypothetical protein EVAR_89825_1 [Eumeta japonica]